MLPPEAAAQLLAAYTQFESGEGGEDARARHRSVAESLCGSVGVDTELRRDSAPSCM